MTDLVFLHGVGGSREAWAPQAQAFGKDYRVTSWNVPGYGGRPLPNDLSFAGLARNLIEELDTERFALVGHSFGGMVAQQVAKDFPERLSCLVLSGTSPAFGNPDGDFQKRFIAQRLEPLDAGKTMADLAPSIVASLVGDDPDEGGLEIARRCMSQVPEATYRAVLNLIVTFDLRDALASIACPTLVLAGENDKSAPAAMMERMSARIPGAKFATLPGAGHLANLEQPDAFNAPLSDFLKEHVS